VSALVARLAVTERSLTIATSPYTFCHTHQNFFTVPKLKISKKKTNKNSPKKSSAVYATGSLTFSPAYFPKRKENYARFPFGCVLKIILYFRYF